MSEDSAGYPGAPPGWYPDPAGGPGQRWWDGYGWTSTTVLPSGEPAPTPHAQGTPPPPRDAQPRWTAGARDARALVSDELRIFPAARFAIALPGFAALVYVISWVANASQWRSFGHQFHLALLAAQNHQAVPVLTAPDSLGWFSSVLVLFALAAIIVDCLWQFRAASAARATGIPARRSPGWGVVFWFVPIVNLWMPYQAIRDCLAYGDPNRPTVLRYWLLFIGMVTGAVLTAIGLMISTPVGVIFATAPKVVISIAVAHRDAVSP